MYGDWITPKLNAFVKTKIKRGLYNNASEVMREALRLMQEHEEVRSLKLKRLRKALTKGEADLTAARSTTLSNDDELDAFFARL